MREAKSKPLFLLPNHRLTVLHKLPDHVPERITQMFTTNIADVAKSTIKHHK